MSSKYGWEIGQPPPTLYVHSLAKHEVLRAYVSRYLRILTGDPRIDHFRITLVDGFSGGGVYLHEVTREELPGSPLLFLESVRETEAELRTSRKKEFCLDAHYVFVERDSQTLAYLTQTLVERGYRSMIDNGQIKLVQGLFAKKAQEIMQFIQGKSSAGRSIFLLDQYGYKDVPFDLLSAIFSTLPRAEVILTFAVDALVDYLTDSPNFEQILAGINLDGELDLGSFTQTKGAGDRRFFIQSRLTPILHRRSGAAFYTPFFIVSRESNRDYWLVHLSMHERARDEMAKLHWELHNYFRHNGGAGLGMLGYDPKSDLALTGQGDFNFDDMARKRSLAQLRTDIPEFLVRHPNGLTFGELVGLTCNTSPATTDFYRDTLDDLLQSGDIIACGKDGTKRRSGRRIAATDVIEVSKTPTLFFRRPR